jgi:hypothetical protein
MNARLRFTILGAVAAATAALGAIPATAAQAAPIHPNGIGPNQYGNIVNSASRACVDVRGDDGSFTDGAHVQNYHCNGTGAQHWNEQATGLPDGSFFIVNQRSQKCIDGGQFWTVQWSCGPVPQQEWRLHTVPGAGAGQFQLENGNGKCLTLTSGNGADSQALSDDACFVNNWFGQLWEVD